MLARFVPVVRTFTPVVAGVARMPRSRFTAYNVAGGLAWTLGLLTVGFYLGGIPLTAAHLELFALAMVALSLIPALVGVVRHRSAHRNGPSQSVEPAEPRVPVGAP